MVNFGDSAAVLRHKLRSRLCRRRGQLSKTPLQVVCDADVASVYLSARAEGTSEWLLPILYIAVVLIEFTFIDIFSAPSF